MTESWTNDAAIAQWNATATREAMEAGATDGDFSKRHLLNPTVLRMLGDVRGQRILDAGCGTGYFSRILAEYGAHVTGVEPTEAMCTFAREREAALKQGITYAQADLTSPDTEEIPALSAASYDAVVCNMVLMAIPDWKPAMRTCVRALRPGGLFVFSLVHPAFEQLSSTWRAHGEYRVRRYLEEYTIVGPAAADFHRPLSAYLNELAALGCRLRELAEPGLDPEVVRREAAAHPGIEACERLPNFLIGCAEAPGTR